MQLAEMEDAAVSLQQGKRESESVPPERERAKGIMSFHFIRS